uniref:Sulfotransferase n=1 Tax=Oryza meridionalis TaxID=40149 RepID=A0A0E0E3I1_9ORYZ
MPHSGDVILTTYPKCGTTWLKSLSFTIVNRSQYSFSNHPLLTRHPQHVVPFIEIHGEETKTRSCRMVYLCRDLKDAFISRWYFENKASMERPEKVMFLKYDIKSDPALVVRKLADFLGMPFTKEEDDGGIPEQVVKLCDFETLANLDSWEELRRRVGDWVNHMSVEMAVRLDRIVQEKLE